MTAPSLLGSIKHTRVQVDPAHYPLNLINMTIEQLLPDEVRPMLPTLYATEDQLDSVAVVRFFYPTCSWSWYVTEFDGDDLFFGLVDGDVPEFGYFRLSEMLATHDAWGLEVERDLY